MSILRERWNVYKDDGSMPAGCELACRYGLHIGADTIEEEALFRRTEKRDELWFHSEGAGSYVYHASRGGTQHAACSRLFEFMARHRRHEGLLGIIEGG
jgi:hypothetical protein